MIRVKVNKADPTDLYEQVAAEIRRAIAEGEANPGERLPPAKDLAPGWYRLKVEVRDPTPWVLEDAEGLLVDRAAWLVEVKAKEE